MHIYVVPGEACSSARSVCGFVSFGRFASSHGALLAGATLILALAFGAPGQALAACGTTMPTGAHAPSSGAGGTHSGATAPHVSGPSGGSSCPTKVSAKPTPLAGVHEPGEAPRRASLAGVHTWAHNTSNTSNGGHLPHPPAPNVALPKP
jgi:hypothetical protein